MKSMGQSNSASRAEGSDSRFATLGLMDGAPRDEVERAYHRLADRFAAQQSWNPEAVRIMAEIAQAHESIIFQRETCSTATIRRQRANSAVRPRDRALDLILTTFVLAMLFVAGLYATNYDFHQSIDAGLTHGQSSSPVAAVAGRLH